MRKVNIAIDGPAGAGKSTVAKQVSAKKGYIYVDTGAMYRAIACYMLDQGVDLTDAEAVAGASTGADISITYEDGVQVVWLNGENVNGRIRTEKVSEAASQTSVNPAVRAHLLNLQRNLAAENSVVMDGRDIGTTILPNAEVKIYLTASSEARANRRYLEYKNKGMEADYQEILSQIIDRDYRDMHREVSPLKQAEDAILVDSSNLNQEQVVDAILAIIDEKTEG